MKYDKMSKEELTNILEIKMGCKVNPSWTQQTLIYIIKEKNKLLSEEENIWSFNDKKFLQFFKSFITKAFFLLIIVLIFRKFFTADANTNQNKSD